MIREIPTEKGFAVIVLLPYHDVDKPAMVIKLKHNKSADTAIKQIKEKRYIGALAGYADEIILVGISYDDSKEHSFIIEKVRF